MYESDNTTGESQWDPPEDVDAVELEQSMLNGFRSSGSSSPFTKQHTLESTSASPAHQLQPKPESGSNLFVRRLVDPNRVQRLVDMGFAEDDAVSALLACDNDVNRACNVLTTKHPRNLVNKGML